MVNETKGLYEEIWALEDRIKELESERKVVVEKITKVESIVKIHGETKVWFTAADHPSRLKAVLTKIDEQIRNVKCEVRGYE